MGWDGTLPTNFKNGRVDRKAEVDERFTWENDSKSVSVLKSIMKGTTYYGAIKIHYKDNKEDYVTGVVALTRMDKRDGYFMVKIMEESCGPCYYDCPESILNLLSPTDNEYALSWREKCKKHSSLPKISNLKEGDVIKFVCPYDTRYHKHGEEIMLEKRMTIRRASGRDTYAWVEVDGYVRWPSHMIPKEFEVLHEVN